MRRRSRQHKSEKVKPRERGYWEPGDVEQRLSSDGVDFA